MMGSAPGFLHCSFGAEDDEGVIAQPMKTAALFFLVLSSILAFAEPSASPPSAPDAATLTQLLKGFLVGAAHNDAAMHDRFWADELIYTRSAGQRLSKADVLREVKAEAAAPKKSDEERRHMAPRTSTSCNTATPLSSHFGWSPRTKRAAQVRYRITSTPAHS